jgi:PAS domain S-box-containing protein
MSLRRPHARYLLTGALVLVIALVNAGTLVLVRDAGSTLHDQAAPRSMRVEQLRLDLSDMNGAQNLYLIQPGGGRPVFIAARAAVRRDIAAARPLENSAVGRRLLAAITSAERRFEQIDGELWASVQSGQLEVARSLAAGVETTVYLRMRQAATALEQDAADRRTEALDAYNTRQSLALGAGVLLAVLALALTAALLAERLRTGRRLDTTEAEHETLLTELPAAVRIYDRDRSRITYANPRYLELYGYTRDQIDRGLPLHWAERLHPDDRRRVIEGWERAAAAGEPWHDRYRWIDTAGAVRWIADSERSLPRAESQRLGIAMDVTAEERAERELEEQRRRYQTLVEKMPLAVYLHGVSEGEDAIYVSPQIEAVLGITEEDWRGACREVAFWERRVHPDDLEPVKRAMGFDGTPQAPAFTLEFRFRGADGRYHWVFNSEEEVLGDDGQPLWRQGLIWDINQRKLAEMRWESLIEHLPGTVAVWSRATLSTIYVSPHIEQLTGEPPSLWLGREGFEQFRSQVHPDDAGDPKQWRYDGQPSLYRWRRSDGREIWIRELDGPTPEQESAVSVLLFDATDEVTAQLALREAQRRAVESLEALVTAAEEERSRIATELHDDTVSDLTAVLMHIRLRMRTHPELEPLEQVVSQALERTRRLMFELRPHILAHDGLQAAIEQTLKVGPADHSWESEIDIDIPRQSDTLEALAYRSIRELVVNARKHSRAAHVSVTGRQQGDRLRFVVEDDGVGFDPATAGRREGAIMHIGLATTRERVELAGGSLEIDSSPGSGARFTITLPAQPRAGAGTPDAEPVAGELR